MNQAVGGLGGCRLRFDPTGALLVGTGDDAVGAHSQGTHSLAGTTGSNTDRVPWVTPR